MTASGDNERLDQLGRALVRAATMTDAEVDRVASALLYSRVRARMSGERQQRLASATWLAILMIGRRTAPAMLIIALTLTGCFWLATRSTRSTPVARDVHLAGELLTGVTLVSDDDVLALLIDGTLTEAPSRENRQ